MSGNDATIKTCVTCRHCLDQPIYKHMPEWPLCTFKGLVRPVEGTLLSCQELRRGPLVRAIVPIGDAYPNVDDVPGSVSCGAIGDWWEPKDA